MRDIGQNYIYCYTCVVFDGTGEIMYGAYFDYSEEHPGNLEYFAYKRIQSDANKNERLLGKYIFALTTISSKADELKEAGIEIVYIVDTSGTLPKFNAKVINNYREQKKDGYEDYVRVMLKYRGKIADVGLETKVFVSDKFRTRVRSREKSLKEELNRQILKDQFKPKEPIAEKVKKPEPTELTPEQIEEIRKKFEENKENDPLYKSLGKVKYYLDIVPESLRN